MQASLFLLLFLSCPEEEGAAHLPRAAKVNRRRHRPGLGGPFPISASIVNSLPRPSLVALVWKMLPCDVIWSFENLSAVSLSRICCSVIGPIPGINLPDKLLTA
jgi:hypothetical protein